MPVEGYNRYLRLFKHINNPGEYIFRKSKRKKRDLQFITKPNRFLFNVPESLYQVFKEIFMVDVYEIDQLVAELSPSPTVIDIGANAGFFDIQLLSKISGATIYAYEPLPSNAAYVNGLMNSNPNIKKYLNFNQFAVTGLPKSGLDLYIAGNEENQVVASVFDNFDKRNTKKITIPSITFTEIIERIGLTEIDLLKMDCEGSEYDILYNTPASHIQVIKQMVIEVHDLDQDKNNIYYLNQYLQGLGYETKYEPINGFCYAFEAKRK
jgi:FkbM family methyltransferase